MSSRWPLFAVVALLGLAGCKESGGSEAEREGENADKPAAQTVSAFYEAADEPDGEEACSLLTADGIRAIVRVGSHAACVRTIDGFDSGSFSDENGELLEDRGCRRARSHDRRQRPAEGAKRRRLHGREDEEGTPAHRRFQAGRGLARQ